MPDLRFLYDAETGEPHVHRHGVREEEVEEVLQGALETRPGREGSWVAIGATEAGRVLRVVYAPDGPPGSLFVITAYDLRGKPLAAFRRRQRRKKRR